MDEFELSRCLLFLKGSTEIVSLLFDEQLEPIIDDEIFVAIEGNIKEARLSMINYILDVAGFEGNYRAAAIEDLQGYADFGNNEDAIKEKLLREVRPIKTVRGVLK